LDLGQGYTEAEKLTLVHPNVFQAKVVIILHDDICYYQGQCPFRVDLFYDSKLTQETPEMSYH